MAHDPVDPDVTARLRAEAHEEGDTPIGYFLSRAAEAATQTERSYWMGRVDGARYFAARQEARDDLADRARENMEAEARLLGTEAAVVIVRTVGNAVVLRLIPGDRQPGGGYSLIRRKSGETATTGYGAPQQLTDYSQWVVQGLERDTAHEFAVVSEDGATSHEVTGPWSLVRIGSVSTADVQADAEAEADQQYREAEAAEAERQRQHSEKVARERAARAAAIKEQEAAAAAERERLERDRLQREEIRKRALEELPLVTPREVQMQLRDQNLPTITMDISFRRGAKMAKLYQFKVNGSVLGYSGEWDGVKPDSHIYRRSVELPRDKTSEVVVYGVTEHGDADVTRTLYVPRSLSYQSASGVLVSGDVGGGRLGFAVRTFENWHVTEVGGRLDIAQQTGVTALFESAGTSGILWVVAAHNRVSAVLIEGLRTDVSPISYVQGAGHLYRGVPASWPSRGERRRGATVTVEVGG